MSDVAKASGSKLQKWETVLAPLSKSQRAALVELDDDCSGRPYPEKFHEELKKKVENKDPLNVSKEEASAEDNKLDHLTSLDSLSEFLKLYATIENDWLDQENSKYEAFKVALEKQLSECSTIMTAVNSSLQKLDELKNEYNLVSGKTNSLHKVSEQLLLEETTLKQLDVEITHHVKHFKDIDRINQLLDSPSLNVSGEVFGQLLNDIDEHLAYIHAHSDYKESSQYQVRYAHALTRILTIVKMRVGDALRSVSLPPGSQVEITPLLITSNYTKVKQLANLLRPIIKNIEDRAAISPDYSNVLSECENHFLQARRSIIPSYVSYEISLVSQERPDPCSLVKAGVGFLIQVCSEEYELYFHYFLRPTESYRDYIEELCTILYDIVRPILIHMQHLETLSELCTVLRHEVQEQIQMYPEALEVLQRVCQQLLQDVEERLVFRANLYFQTDILNYKPSPGDLAYPEKLETMQKISESLMTEASLGGGLYRTNSHSSLASEKSTTCEEVSRINKHAQKNVTNSVDMQGLWYPPVRRTLVCLSRLYRCVEKPIFQGVSQEAVSMCIQSIAEAGGMISSSKTPLDGELFQIKHLLILREQIAPFQVDFTSKEVSLDFNKVKDVAYSLLTTKRSKLFSLDSTNSILELLVSGGAPFIKEQYLDSRKDVDRNLKSSCENLIRHATLLVASRLQELVDKIKSETAANKKPSKPSASSISEIVQETIKKIKEHLPSIQKKMSLYLVNPDTQFILYRPIKNNVIGLFCQLHNFLTTNYSAEDLLLIGCPTSEHVSILLSSVSLVTKKSPIPES